MKHENAVLELHVSNCETARSIVFSFGFTPVNRQATLFSFLTRTFLYAGRVSQIDFDLFEHRDAPAIVLRPRLQTLRRTSRTPSCNEFQAARSVSGLERFRHGLVEIGFCFLLKGLSSGAATAALDRASGARLGKWSQEKS